MGLVRWAPWLFMLVADVFPGGCCGGSRYRPGPPEPPQPPRGMSIVNHTNVQICSIGAAPDTGAPPRSYESLMETHLAPGASTLVGFPAHPQFVLRVMSCDSKELLVKPGLAPQEGIVTIEVGEGGGGFATPP